MSKRLMIVWISTVAVALIGGFFYGREIGNNHGYEKAKTELKKIQEETAQKAAENAAKSANPFQAANPLEGIEVNPFEKALKAVNPFK